MERNRPLTRQRLAATLWREDGTFAVFSLFVFVSMLLVAGLAIDLMRHETVRLRMQGVTDRATLAATMMRQTSANATAEQILTSYFAAEGLEAQLGDNFSIVDDAETGRTVTVVPGATVPSLFMSLLGIEDFAVATPAQAREAVAGRVRLELVMVLDVSGSMSGQGKIDVMRTAAAQLVTTLLTDTEDGDVAITLVPYDSWVLPPSGFLNSFTSVTGSGACNDWLAWDTVLNSLSQPTERRQCNGDVWAQILPYEDNATDAVAAINALVARGTTSIDLGVRWGAMFFDPSINPAINDMITAGAVSNVFSDRPFAWDKPDLVRAMILLTDGQNCCGARYTQYQQDLNATAVCAELKEENVIIYSIAFQAPTAGAALMQSCASSSSHYFNADVSELLSVFEAIGNNVQTQALRLTQ